MRKSKYLVDILAEAETEEDLKFAFAKYMKLKPSSKKFIDLYTKQILFEFKLNANFTRLHERAKVIAQALYYIRRLKFGRDDRPPSQNICIVAKKFGALFPTETFAEFYERNSYDWDLKPSSPCKKLVNDLADFDAVKNAHVYEFADTHGDGMNFVTRVQNIRNQYVDSPVKKQINEQNFYEVFKSWERKFGAAVKNGRKPSEYFIIDIEADKSETLKRGVLFYMNNNESVRKSINPEEHRHFWNTYEKISDARQIIAIRQKMDRLTEINLRRRTGEYYTPIAFANKAFDYLTRTVGDWWTRGDFRLWDMAAGTGNLEFAVPPEARKFCYVSTLSDDDTEYCKIILPTATVFQYDYLNDDADKLPENLRADLDNPDIKWIIFINPPYATANNYERDKSKVTKDGVSMTAIQKLMKADKLGKASQELTSQFVYRISRDFADRQAWLGMFSKIKYINANADQKFRDKVFRYKFERGFVFNAKNFDGCKAQFPVGFLVWDLSTKQPLETQTISLDVFDENVDKFAEKIFPAVNANDTLNNWIDRTLPHRTKKFPPMVSALNFGFDAKDLHDTIAENALASMMCKGNDFLNQNGVAILSAPYASGHDISVTPENFEQAMIVHMVRRLPKATWLNDRDQFMQPTKKLTPEFVSDAVVWSLFAPSNQTASLRDVKYEGEVYQIRNNFFPFTLAEVRTWRCSSIKIVQLIDSAREDRFAALWLKAHADELSTEARDVLSAGREVYKKFFAQLSTLELSRWKIDDWDAGWYQIRMALGATVDLSALSTKLKPQIYEFSFLRDELKLFGDAE